MRFCRLLTNKVIELLGKRYQVESEEVLNQKTFRDVIIGIAPMRNESVFNAYLIGRANSLTFDENINSDVNSH